MVFNVKKMSFSQPEEKVNGLKSDVGKRSNTVFYSLQQIFLFSPFFFPPELTVTKPVLTFFCLIPVKILNSLLSGEPVALE